MHESLLWYVAGPCCAAVGGCVQPVNTFTLLSPWLAVIALVGCIGTVRKLWHWSNQSLLNIGEEYILN